MLASLSGLMLWHEAAAAPTKIRLGMASEGSGFVLYGGAFVDALKSVEPSLEIRESITGGTLDNVSMLERGELDIGFVSGEVVHELLAGLGRPPAAAVPTTDEAWTDAHAGSTSRVRRRR